MRLPTTLLAALTAAASVAQIQPAMFRGNPAHTGLFDTQHATSLTVRWKLKTGGPILSSPVVSGNSVYVGSTDGNLYAVNDAAGTVRWRFATHGDVNSSPAVSGGILYAESLDGNLYAVDTATGKQRWSFATRGERRVTGRGILYALPQGETFPDPWDLFLSSPVVIDGLVVFGSGDDNVYALDAQTGTLKWKFTTGDVVHASPAVADGVVYVGSADTWFYALGESDGKMLWKFKTGDDAQARLMCGIPGSATVADGAVYFGCRDANVYALDAKTGVIRWRLPEDGSWVVSSPAVVDNTVYITTSDSHKFQAVAATTGHLVYSLPYNVASFSSPSIADGRAYFGTFDGQLREVDISRGAYTGQFATDASLANAPRYVDANGALKENFWTGDTIDDVILNLRGKEFSMGSILSSPAIADGIVYVGSADGYLYALGG